MKPYEAVPFWDRVRHISFVPTKHPSPTSPRDETKAPVNVPNPHSMGRLWGRLDDRGRVKVFCCPRLLQPGELQALQSCRDGCELMRIHVFGIAIDVCVSPRCPSQTSTLLHEATGRLPEGNRQDFSLS